MKSLVWQSFVLNGYIRRLAVAASLCLGAAILAGPAVALEDDFQTWTMITAQQKLHGKLQGYVEAQPRYGNNATEISRLLLRPAIGVQITPEFSLWQGIAWTPVFHPGYNSEIRLFQQSLVENHPGKFTVINRTRMEERYIENLGEPSYRLRHMLRATHPVGKSGKYYLAAFDELFFNLNTAGSIGSHPSGFDQNRLFAGLGRRLSKTTALEAGYMNNIVRTAAEDRMNHVLLVWFSFRR